MAPLIVRRNIAKEVVFDIIVQLCMGLHYCHHPSLATGDVVLHRSSRRTLSRGCITHAQKLACHPSSMHKAR
jgi:hypothetical protein